MRLGKRIVSLAMAILLCIPQMTASAEPDSQEEGLSESIVAESVVPEGVVLNYHDTEEKAASFSGEGLGDIPNIKASTLPVSYSSSGKIPASIQVQEKGDWVTSAKMQQGGTCWAHAATSVAETNYLMDHVQDADITSDNTDFDEYRLAYFVYHTPTEPLGLTQGDGNSIPSDVSYLDNGGNNGITLRMYANWLGTSNDMNFTPDIVNEGNATSLAYEEDAAHLENGYVLAMPDMSSQNYDTDMNVLKQMIKDYGSAAVSYYADQSAQEAEYYRNGYYYYPYTQNINHGVTIVGWDDTVSADNFATAPAGDGAWLVKNSWGTDWGLGGYFWLSYYDASIDNVAYVWDFTDADNYDNNYQYDGSGISTAAVYSSGVDHLSAANAFVADSKEILRAVSFYTDQVNTDYEVNIYTKLGEGDLPQEGTLALTQSGTEIYGGYHTVKLDTPVSLEAGERYAVAVTLKKQGTTIKMGVDQSADWRWIKFTSVARKGESYLGDSVDRLRDLNPENTASMDGINVRIKAFTDEVISVSGITLDQDTLTLESGQSVRLNATVQPETSSNQKVLWTSADEAIAAVDKNGMVTANSSGKAGTVIITAKTADGGKTAQCSVTVNPVHVTGVTLQQTDITLQTNEKITLTATVQPENATNKTLVWNSNNPGAAKVDDKGVVTAIGKGEAVITVKTQDGQKSAQCHVAVKDGRSIPDGIYRIVSRLDSNKSAAVADASSKNGANVQLEGKNGSYAQMFDVKYLGEGYYRIQSLASDKALDIAAGSKEPGTNLQQYVWNDTAAQQWKFVDAGDGYYYIQSKLGTVIDVAAGNPDSGTNIQMYSCNQSDAQQWKLEKADLKTVPEGRYEIRSSVKVDKTLDIQGAVSENGGNVQIWSGNSSQAQQFDITYIADGYYKITAACSGKVLDVAAGSSAAGANLQQYAWNGSDAQLWRFVKRQDGSYYIKSKLGTVMDLSAGRTEDGTNVQLYVSNQSAAQCWKLDSVTNRNIPEGTYEIVTALNEKKTLDIAAASVQNGANIQLWERNGSKAQKFKVQYVAEGYYKIVAGCSGKVLDICGGSDRSGTNLQQYDWNGSAAQLWKFVDAGNGTYYIQSKLGTVLDVSGARTDNGNNVWVYSKNNSKAQIWKLK